MIKTLEKNIVSPYRELRSRVHTRYSCWEKSRIDISRKPTPPSNKKKSKILTLEIYIREIYSRSKKYILQDESLREVSFRGGVEEECAGGYDTAKGELVSVL